jgi:hypothetical protein
VTLKLAAYFIAGFVLYPSVSFLRGSDFMRICAGAGKTPTTVNTSVGRTRRYLTGRESRSSSKPLASTVATGIGTPP